MTAYYSPINTKSVAWSPLSLVLLFMQCSKLREIKQNSKMNILLIRDTRCSTCAVEEFSRVRNIHEVNVRSVDDGIDVHFCDMPRSAIISIKFR